MVPAASRDQPVLSACEQHPSPPACSSAPQAQGYVARSAYKLLE